MIISGKPNKTFYLLATAWLLMQTVLCWANGVGLTNEAEKYIGQAYHLQYDHHIDDSKYIFYFIPIFLIFVSLKLHAGFAFVVAVQLFINALATAAFYKVCMALLCNTRAAFAATLFFISFFPIQYWNTFLYTESVFYSLCIFFMYALVVLPSAKLSTHIVRALVVAALLFTRPLGILFLPVTFFFYLAQRSFKTVLKWLIGAAVCIGVYGLVNFLYHSNADMDILMPQIHGSVICFGPAVYTNPKLRVTNTGTPVSDLAWFILHNPWYFLKLATARLGSFFNLYRPEYSIVHNAYLILCMLVLYGLAIFSVIRSVLIKTAPFKYIFIPLLVIFCIGVMLQCDDFNSRFSMPLFPWIILLAAGGLLTLFKKST